MVFNLASASAFYQISKYLREKSSRNTSQAYIPFVRHKAVWPS